jgi:GH15 family glucan-1,4-alpha-glucosidase
MSYQPIEDYGLIGDLQTAALVSTSGSIDFLCFPRFDSPTIFAALLDDKKGGHFIIAPASGEFSHRQRYLPDTNIILTRFLGAQGVAEVSDFMPVRHPGHPHSLVRRVKVVRGKIPLRMVCEPKFEYGSAGHSIMKRPDGLTFCPETKQQPALRLRSSVPVVARDGKAVANFTLGSGKAASFVLEEAVGESPSESSNYVSEAFKETMNFWFWWVRRSRYRGRWREIVNRSALTLKLLTSLPHGSIVAAPTFGLPAHVGSVRNWDYRYTWIRDASFTLYALMRLGYTDEARAFMSWIDDRCREHARGSPLQVMYRIDGNAYLPEKQLKCFEGYKNSSPVRIGNAASSQLQLDIFGELMDSVHIYDKHGTPISYDLWTDLVKLVEWVCRNWHKPDNGIWEVRGGARPFLYSRAMCWVALDRALQIARRRSYPAPLPRWHRVRDEVYRDIYDNFWNPRLNAFVQFRGAKTVDASALLLPLVKFISPDDPRWRSTLKAIEKTLVEDSSVFRYRPGPAAPDGLRGTEGTFSVCSFWYAECLARTGDARQARFIFEKALGGTNHLGLFAEQIGANGEHLGNFPQALSHLGLISAAWTLDQKLSELPEDSEQAKAMEDVFVQ